MLKENKIVSNFKLFGLFMLIHFIFNTEFYIFYGKKNNIYMYFWENP